MSEWVIRILSNNVAPALIITLLTWLAGAFFTLRGRLIWSVTHQHMFIVPPQQQGQPPLPLRTQHVWLFNAGRKTIEQIEIVFNHRPFHFEIWPPRVYEHTVLDNGRLSVRSATLAPREGFTISVVQTTGDLPAVVIAKWRDGPAHYVQMMPQRVFPKWLQRVFLAFALLGMFTGVYFLLLLGRMAWPSLT